MRGLYSAETDPSSVSPLRFSDHLLPQGEKGREHRRYLPNFSAAHAYRLPGTGCFAAAAFGRDVQADDLGIGEQC